MDEFTNLLIVSEHNQLLVEGSSKADRVLTESLSEFLLYIDRGSKFLIFDRVLR